MIIVSQDKSKIVNFDNIVEIGIYKIKDIFRITAENNEIDKNLGEYKTEERAKEILEEIVKNYESKLLVKFKGYLNGENERAMLKKYKYLSENTSVFVSDETKDFQYIPCQKNVYYMPEE